MTSHYCRDKSFQYKIEGRSKPFIDQNLQLQLPGYENPEDAALHSHMIYSHYAGSFPSYFSSEINEAELYQAIGDAKHSFEAWQQMQQKLLEAMLSYQKRNAL